MGKRIALSEFAGGVVAYNAHWKKILSHRKDAVVVALCDHSYPRYKDLKILAGDRVKVIGAEDGHLILQRIVDDFVYKWPESHLHFYRLC